MMKKAISGLLALSMIIVLSVPAFANSTSFTANAGGSGSTKIAGPVELTGVIETKTYKNNIGHAPISEAFEYHGFPEEFPVQTIKAGTTISLEGLSFWKVYRLSNVDGVLGVWQGDKANWSSIMEKHKADTSDKDDFLFGKGSYINFKEDGFYMLYTGRGNPMETVHESNAPKENTVLIYVTGGNPVDTSDSKATGSNSASSPSSDSKEKPANTPAEKQTEPEKATTSQAQTISSSDMVYTVKAGDTLATIALNFYGDVAYWPQLQEANREYLAQTKDGIIFVGFNLLLPGNIGNGIIPAATAGTGEGLYTVKAGDTYATIAQAHFGNAGRYMEIFNRNTDRLKDINTLVEGQIIVLPVK